MNQLEGKTALVTGGTSGIGLATAQRFAEEGAHVFVTGRRQAELDQAVTSIGHGAVGVRGDVSDLTDLDEIYAAIAQRGRGLDVLFANAGGGSFATLEELDARTSTRLSPSTSGARSFTVQKDLLCRTRVPRLSCPARLPPPAALPPSASTPQPRPLSARSDGRGRWSWPAVAYGST